MTLIVIITILIFFSGLIKALLDYSSIDGFKNPWWNKSASWTNKWKLKDGNPIPNNKRPFYYLFMFKPNYIEKFPYSSTALVAFTDGWHLLQKILYTLIFQSISLLLSAYLNISTDIIETVCSFLILTLIFTISFEVLYKKITTNENS